MVCCCQGVVFFLLSLKKRVFLREERVNFFWDEIGPSIPLVWEAKLVLLASILMIRTDHSQSYFQSMLIRFTLIPTFTI